MPLVQSAAGIDIGGTKVAAGRFSVSADGDISLQQSAVVLLEQVTSCAELFSSIEDQIGVSFRELAAVGVAGAGILNSAGDFEHHYPFIMSAGPELVSRGAQRFRLMNDFEAQAWALATSVAGSARHILGPVSGEVKGAKGILGPGTGLGIAGLISTERGLAVIRSEGGHDYLPTFDSSNLDFEKFIHNKLSGLSRIEAVLCGSGLALCHEFVTGKRVDSIEVVEEATDETKCLFAKYLAMKVRSVGLTFYATGGIYLTGGVLSRSPEILDYPEFSETLFKAESRRELLETMPIFHMANTDAPLYGAAFAALQ